MSDTEPFPLTYQRGYRHVFSALEVQGAMPSSPTQHIDKGKGKVTEPITVEEENKHETEQ